MGVETYPVISLNVKDMNRLLLLFLTLVCARKKLMDRVRMITDFRFDERDFFVLNSPY